MYVPPSHIPPPPLLPLPTSYPSPAEASASSPLSSALSPTESDGIPHSATTSVQARPNAAQNPLLRHAITCGSLGPGEIKQHRKCSRVSPYQLLKLEEYRPTSARRRDIARDLGMDECQT